MILFSLILGGFFIRPARASTEDLYCIARAVYHESRGEPLLGQIAVAYVVINRMKSGFFPAKACDVIYQKHQFTHLTPQTPIDDEDAWYIAVYAAGLAYDRQVLDPTNGALCFYAPALVRHEPDFGERTIMIGGHSFHKCIELAYNG